MHGICMGVVGGCAHIHIPIQTCALAWDGRLITNLVIELSAREAESDASAAALDERRDRLRDGELLEGGGRSAGGSTGGRKQQRREQRRSIDEAACTCARGAELCEPSGATRAADAHPTLAEQLSADLLQDVLREREQLGRWRRQH